MRDIRTIKQELKKIKERNPKEDVMIVRNGCILALHNPEHLLNVIDNKSWKDATVVEVKKRSQDTLIVLE